MEEDLTRQIAALFQRTKWSERQQAITAVVQQGEMAVGPLIRALHDNRADPYEWGRAAVVEALGKIGAAEAVKALIPLLDSPNLALRQAVAQALGRIKDPRAIAPIIETFRHEPSAHYQDSNFIELWQEAADALVNIGPPALHPLVTVLSDPQANVRAWAADALGGLRDTRATLPLIRTLRHDDDFQVREDSADALGEIGDVRAVGPLLDTLREDPEDMVRAHATYALGYIVQGEVLEQLIKAATADRSRDVRVGAIHALQKSAGTRVVPLFVSLLRDPDACVRSAACLALSYVGDRDTISALEVALANDGGRCKATTVRHAAEHAIKRIRERLAT